MQQATRLIGTLIKLAPAGLAWATPTTGTVGRDALPPDDALTAAPGPIWIDAGIIREAQEQTSSTEIEVFRPSPGVLQLDDVLETKFKRELSLEISECSNYMWLLLRKCLKTTSPLSGGLGQHVALSGGISKFWVKIQDYDGQDNSLLLVEQSWCHAMIDGAVARGGDKEVTFKLKLRQLWSPLNSALGY